MPLGGAVIAGAGLLYGAYKSERDNAKANKIAEGLKDPTFNIPPEFYQNREIARQMAQIGIPQQQYNNAVNGINQNNAAGLATLSRSANPGAGVTAVTRQADNAHASLDASDAAARQNNERYFINENAQLGNQELAKQQSDVFDKYTRDFNQMQAYRGSATTGMNNAIQGAQNLGLTYLNYNANNPNTGSLTAPTNKYDGGLITSAQDFMKTNPAAVSPTSPSTLPMLGNYNQQVLGTGLPNQAPFQRQPQYQPGVPQYYGQNWGWPNQ